MVSEALANPSGRQDELELTWLCDVLKLQREELAKIHPTRRLQEADAASALAVMMVLKSRREASDSRSSTSRLASRRKAGRFSRAGRLSVSW
eukprot:15375869-Alexandrium_andersonii.AAC.1